MSFRCAVDLVGRLHKKFAGILTYVKDFLYKMTAEDTVQMSGRRFLEVPISYYPDSLPRRWTTTAVARARNIMMPIRAGNAALKNSIVKSPTFVIIKFTASRNITATAKITTVLSTPENGSETSI